MIAANARKNKFIADQPSEAEAAEAKIEIINQRIEHCIDRITAQYSGRSDVRLVGVVDPPRAGVHPAVAKKLRTFKVG